MRHGERGGKGKKGKGRKGWDENAPPQKKNKFLVMALGSELPTVRRGCERGRLYGVYMQPNLQVLPVSVDVSAPPASTIETIGLP